MKRGSQVNFKVKFLGQFSQVKTASKSKKAEPKKDEPKDPFAELTDKVIREMSTYYALAIQRHSSSLENMKKEVMASFYYKISTDEFPQHANCNYEWCKDIQNTAAGTDFEHPPPWIRRFSLWWKRSLNPCQMTISCADVWEKTTKTQTNAATRVCVSWLRNTCTWARKSLK